MKSRGKVKREAGVVFGNVKRGAEANDRIKHMAYTMKPL
jgi:hypothetical protein